MPQLTLSSLHAQIASGQTNPLYMLVGDDETEKSAVALLFVEMVDEGLQAFNVDRLYGGDMKVDDLIQTAAILPMMAPRRIVIVLEADKLLMPRRESKAADEEQERLEHLLESPPSHSTVVFVCGPLDERRRSVRLLRRQATVVDCGTIADAADAARYVRARASREGATLEPAAVQALVDRAGVDIVRLRAGLERVMLYALGQPKISATDVKQVVPAAPEAQEDFGIAKAIWRNDAADALRELNLALEAGVVPVMLMGQLRTAAERLRASYLREAVDAVFRTDLALKSSGGEPRILLERLVVELCELQSPRMRSARR
jgi:DNA polymerase III subunit delta